MKSQAIFNLKFNQICFYWIRSLAVLEGGVEEGERADVQPPAADDGKGDDLDDEQEGHL